MSEQICLPKRDSLCRCMPLMSTMAKSFCRRRTMNSWCLISAAVRLFEPPDDDVPSYKLEQTTRRWEPQSQLCLTRTQMDGLCSKPLQFVTVLPIRTFETDSVQLNLQSDLRRDSWPQRTQILCTIPVGHSRSKEKQSYSEYK